MTFHVVFTPEAEAHLEELYTYIAEAANAQVAQDYVEALIVHCEALDEFPYRGLARDDIRPGLRTMSFRKRTVIAFAVLGETVAIVGIFHGGRDYESALGSAPEE